MKKCPFCAEEIQDAAIVCRYCGRDLPEPVTSPQPAMRPPATPSPTTPPIQAKKPTKGTSSLVTKLGLVVAGLCFLTICLIAVVRSGSETAKVQPTETVQATDVVASTNTPVVINTPKPTNTPRPTSTRRPTATPGIGTLDNPHPYGEEAFLTRTSRGQKSDFTFQVLNVIRGDDANRIVKNANMFNDDPPAGASWMLVQVKVTLLDGAAFTLDSYDVAVISGGQLFGGFDFSVCCTDDIGYAELDASIALPGTSVEGWIIRPVLLPDENPLLALGIDSFEPDLKDGLYFSLQP